MDLSTMERACAATERVVQAVRPDQLSEPTPCPDWDVRGLLNHLVAVLRVHAALLRDEPPDVGMEPSGQADRDVLGDDPLKAYRSGVEAILAAAITNDALDRVHTTPMGDLPGDTHASFVMMDVVVHGWDLARATRQAFVIDDDIAEELLGFVGWSIPDEMRAPHIGPAVTPAPEASTVDQLVAFLGRTP